MSEDQQDTTYFCINKSCKKEISQDAKFCPDCGTVQSAQKDTIIIKRTPINLSLSMKIIIAVICLLILIAWTIWPTPWQYNEITMDFGYYVKDKRTEKITARINRINGYTTVFTPQGWVGAEVYKPSDQSQSMLKNIIVDGDFYLYNNETFFETAVSNKTDWLLISVTVKFSTKDGLTDEYTIDDIMSPKHVTKSKIQLSPSFARKVGNKQLDCEVTEARGFPRGHLRNP